MKLKNIFITFLSTIAITACTNEEIIDNPGIAKSQEVPSVLVLGTDLGNSLTATKSEKEMPTLYAFVFDVKTGKCIGANKSASAEINRDAISTVITGIEDSYAYLDFTETEKPTAAQVQIGDNEVVIDGFNMKVGESMPVQVLLIANPLGNNIGVLEGYLNPEYNINNLSIDIFKADKSWDLSNQLWEVQDDETNHTLTPIDDLTAIQWFKMDLKAGINCLGDKNLNKKEIDKDWFNRNNITIPLYRLVAQVDLKVTNNISEAKDGEYFDIVGVRPSRVLCSSCVPDNIVDLNAVSNIDYTDGDVVYGEWCKSMTNELVELSSWAGIQLGRYIDNTEIAKGDNIDASYYIFEQNSENKLEVFGKYYKIVNGEEVGTDVTYTYIFNENFKFLRNKIYTINMTVTKAPSIDGEIIPIGDNLQLEIADMIDLSHDVSFGK